MPVCLPIVGLAEPLDVVNYVRRLEEALIKVCTGLGIEAGRVEGCPVVPGQPARKIAAIGVRVARARRRCMGSRRTATATRRVHHDRAVRDHRCGVTSVTAELGRPVTVAEVRDVVAEVVCDALDGLLPVREHLAARVTSRA